MKKILTLMVVGLIFLNCGNSEKPAYSDQQKKDVDISEWVGDISKSVVLITTYDWDGHKISQGSGFFINKEGEAVSNFHVFKNAVKATVKTSTGKIYPVTGITAEDETRDIIGFSTGIPEEEVTSLPLSNPKVVVGQPVVVIGNPLGFDQTVSEGIVSSVRKIKEKGTLYQISAPISPGSSGSPVINNRGEVISMASCQAVEGQNINFSIPARVIKTAVTKKQDVFFFRYWNREKQSALNLARKYFEKAQGQIGKNNTLARVNLQEAVRISPGYFEAYNLLGIAEYYDRNLTGAIKSLEKALEINPRYNPSYVTLCSIYLNSGKQAKALAFIQTALKSNPVPELYYQLGIVYEQSREFDKALKAYRKMVELDPGNSLGHKAAGLVYRELKKTEESIAAFKKAISIKADDAIAHLWLGKSYQDSDQQELALKAFKQVQLIEPENKQIHYHLCLTYMNLGDAEAAQKELELLNKYKPKLAQKLLNQIQQYKK